MLRNDIIRFIQDNLLHSNDAIDPEESLIDRGLIDSIGLMQLLGFLESSTGVRVPDRMVTPDNFQSVTAMERMVEQLKA